VSDMKKLHIAFYFCWVAAMLGGWVMNLGYITTGKFIIFGFVLAGAMIGFFCFAVSVRSRYFQPPE